MEYAGFYAFEEISFAELGYSLQISAVDWRCRIRRLDLCWEAKDSHQLMSWIWRKTIWCTWIFRKCEYSFIDIHPMSTIIKSALLAEIRWSACVWKSHRILCVIFTRTESALCIYNVVVCFNFTFLHNSQWISFPTQSFLVLYSFLASLLHSIIMWWMVLYLSSHNPHLLFCYVLSIFALI